MTFHVAAGAASDSQPSGLFLIAWGLMASGFGFAMLTNFRGFTDNFVSRLEARSRSSARHIRSVVTLVAAVFAIAGPITAVAGVVAAGRGQIVVHSPAPLRAPLSYLVIAISGVIVGWNWFSPRSLYRSAARSGGWRLAIAVLASLGGLTFGVCLAIGQFTIGLIALLAVGVPSLLLLTDDKRRTPKR